MKILLLQDVKKVGRKGEVVDVPGGQAQNMLIPRGLARPATAEVQKTVAQTTQQNMKQAQTQQERDISLLKRLHDEVVELNRPVNEKGHLFSGVQKKDVSEAIEVAAKQSVPENWMVTEDLFPIKEVGDYKINLSAHNEQVTLIVRVGSDA